MKSRERMRVLVLLAPLLAACTGARTDTVGPSPSPIPGQPPPPPPPPSYVVTLVGAGDIADCSWQGGSNAEATAKLVDKIAGTVFTAGDNAYFNGSAEEFNNCYQPRWGRFKNRTYPSPGNHEYQPPSFGIPYFNYFGDRAGPRGAGFYSYDLGNWHIISLNSNVAVGPGQEQYMWLQRDLEANKNTNLGKCNLAYWHHPLFTSGPSAGTSLSMRSIWSLLYDYGVDVVINGHDHLYERFPPQDVNGRRDAFGIQEYIVGTGGAPLYDFSGPSNSVYRNNRVYGVLKLTLRDVGWDSVFIDAGTEAMLDSSPNNLCH
jgi:hypothetical protein